VVEGFLTGCTARPKFGFSQEFAEYRSYSEGDDPRFVDWNVYARTERTYIKRYIGETNTRLVIAARRERVDGLRLRRRSRSCSTRSSLPRRSRTSPPPARCGRA
jgi:uncharacterized protein (DUF58 family)